MYMFFDIVHILTVKLIRTLIIIALALEAFRGASKGDDLPFVDLGTESNGMWQTCAILNDDSVKGWDHGSRGTAEFWK